MKIDDVRRTAYSMPLTNPSFPPGPYRFFNREYFIITYRTDPDALAAVVPEPLEVTEPVVKYEFIRMPDSTGFGDYTETGQVIPVRFKGEEGVYVHSMYLDDEGPIAGGRELWGFPKKLASPKIAVESDVLVGTLALRLGALRLRHHGLQAPPGRSRRGAEGDEGAELHAQDHPACRRQPADLRTGALLSGRHHAEGSMDRPRGARPVPARALPTWRGCRCAKWSPRCIARRI